MNLFSRITATLEASANDVVSRFENHDAIAEAALGEARQALTQALQRYSRLRKNGDDLRKRLADAHEEAGLWTTRARKAADSDESRALECLALRKQCHERIDQLEQSLIRHETLEEQLSSQLKHMQSRLERMSNQRNEMRSRESMAKAMHVMDRIDSTGSDSVDAVFERWEMTIGDAECRYDDHIDPGSAKSALQRELEAEEQAAALKEELTLLLSDREETSDARS